MTAAKPRCHRRFGALFPGLTTFAAIALAACGGEPEGAAAAERTFAAFQQALHRHDVEACRQLLTVESQAALAELPWQRIAAQQPLEIEGGHRQGDRGFTYVVDVRDPNRGDAPGAYVVVREYGRLVVDLVASAGMHAEVVEASAGGDGFAPRELTPADYDRIREYELAQPPGSKPDRN